MISGSDFPLEDVCWKDHEVGQVEGQVAWD